MRIVRIWGYDDCLASAVTGPLEVFSTANALWRQEQGELAGPLFGWSIESLRGRPIATHSGIVLGADGPIALTDDWRADAVLLPGLACERGVRGLLARLDQLGPLYPALRKAHERGSVVAANCSATFLLAEAGMLEGRRATTTWWLTHAFRERYPGVQLEPAEIVTEHDGVVCSAAATAYMNLALYLVDRFAGSAMASACARLLLVDANRASQAPYVATTLQEHHSHDDPVVASAEHWIKERVRRPFGLSELARAMAVSQRTLIRRFNRALRMTPTEYAHSVRVEVAKGLLETSTLAIERIADRVGYSDVAAFRRIFKREAGILPSEYRERFARHDLAAGRKRAPAGS